MTDQTFYKKTPVLGLAISYTHISAVFPNDTLLKTRIKYIQILQNEVILLFFQKSVNESLSGV